MKNLKCFIIFILIGLFNFNGLRSATYYISSSSGNDRHTQEQATSQHTPWKSLEKLNSFFKNLTPGDSILFKRGDVFEGSIHLSASGQHKNPIVISAYGEGHSPVISGWKNISSWNEHTKNGIWTAKTSRKTPLNLLTLDDVVKEKGQYPNSGFLEYSVSENGLITFDAGINPKEWEPGTLVMRKNQWIIDKITPQEYTSDGFILQTNMRYPPKTGLGLIIQDNINTLNKEGDWYYDADKESLYLYLSKGNPNTKNIRIAIEDHLVSNRRGIQHIKILDLFFSGSNLSAIHLENAFHIEITQCSIEFAGEDALYAVDVPNIKFIKNKISMVMNNGVFLRYGTPNSIVEDNDITDVHPFFSMGKSGDGNGIGIHSISDFGVVSNNRLTNIGYSGIVFNGIKTVVERNHIKNYCTVKNDGGGIYTYQGNDDKLKFGRIVRENIIENGIGSVFATRMNENVSLPQVEGIYLDDNSSGITVIGNTVVNSKRNGIHIHNGKNIQVLQNKIFNCSNQIALSDDDLGGRIENITIEENQFVVFSENQYIMTISSNSNNHSAMAKFRDNTYASLSNKDFLFIIKRQKENNEFETKFMDFEMMVNFGLKDDLPLIINLNTNIEPEKASSEYMIEVVNLPTSTFEKSNGDIDVSVNQEKIVLRSYKPFSVLSVGFPKVSENYSYEIAFDAKSEKPQVIQFLLRIDGRPWSNLSTIYPLKINPDKKEYAVRMNKLINADQVRLLIFSQDKIEKMEIKDVRITTYPIEKPTSNTYVYNNPTDGDVFIPDVTKIVIPSRNSENPDRIGPFQSILLKR